MTDETREECAKLVLAMLDQPPWKDQMWARCALSIAARAIRRGRHLTDSEKLNNLANAMEESDLENDSTELAPLIASMRQAAST